MKEYIIVVTYNFDTDFVAVKCKTYEDALEKLNKLLNEEIETAKNTNELLDHLIKIVEKNNERFSFEWATGGEAAKMEIYDKEKRIGYMVSIEPVKYDENGNAVNL